MLANHPTIRQTVPDYAPPTWPTGPRPQMLHLDTVVPAVDELARELVDRSEDPDEPLFVLTDRAGHPFCIFVAD
jgi:hypothetical protein